MSHRTAALACALLGLSAALSCRGEAAGGPGGGPPPMGVEVVTLEPHPVERTTEYIAAIRSRRSTEILPEAEGFVRRIAVRSGDRVRAGQVLLEIDAGRQAAAVASLEAQLHALQADTDYARQQAQRLETVYRAGAVSQQELEEAQARLRSDEARTEAIRQQIREEKVSLGYHRVTAPVDGIVGDVPVRVGDRVTNQTVLTTLTSNAGLEAYINVPVQQAAGLRAGLPVRLVDDAGTVLAETAVSFVAPAVEEGTQSVLAKAPVPEGSGFRNEQVVRARIVWNAEPGLTVPVTAVNRVGGRYFAFVAEEAEGKTVARLHPIQVGPIVGNDYVVLAGLDPGERLIVSGVQKIGDGAPVAPRPAGQAPAAPQAAPAEPPRS